MFPSRLFAPRYFAPRYFPRRPAFVFRPRHPVIVYGEPAMPTQPARPRPVTQAAPTQRLYALPPTGEGPAWWPTPRAWQARPDEQPPTPARRTTAHTETETGWWPYTQTRPACPPGAPGPPPDAPGPPPRQAIHATETGWWPCPQAPSARPQAVPVPSPRQGGPGWAWGPSDTWWVRQSPRHLPEDGVGPITTIPEAVVWAGRTNVTMAWAGLTNTGATWD